MARGAVRVLVYHGLCRDEQRGAAWMPSHYVTQSEFDRQLTVLRRLGAIVDLREELAEAACGWHSHQARFVITFDDAPANLLTLAEPVLAAHGVRATFFAVTDRLEDGAVLPDDRRRIERAISQSDAAEIPNATAALRHMTWDEALQMIHLGHWMGAHTQTHVRLSACDEAVRRREIENSVAAIRARLHADDVPFAFPYGQAADFGPQDVRLLRELEVPAACTGVPGWNRPPWEPLLLRRNCVGLHHRGSRFFAEVLGLRDGRGRPATSGSTRHAPVAAR